MPALSRSSLLQLVGFDSNVIVSELIATETWITDMVLARSIGRTVASVSGTTITFSGGDNSVFSIGQFLTFADDLNLYAITAVAATTVTVVRAPSTKIQGDDILQSFNIDPASTFQFRATEYTTTGITETRGTIDLGTVAPKVPANNLVLDASVIPIDLTKSWIRLALPSNTFASSPPPLGDVPNGSTYIPFAGYLSITQPPAAVSPSQNPSTTDIQRFVWLNSSKLSV